MPALQMVAQPAATMTVVQQALPPVPAATQALSGDIGTLARATSEVAAPAVQLEAALVMQDHVQQLATQVRGELWL